MKLPIFAAFAILCCGSVFAGETNQTLAIDGSTYSNITWGTVTPASVTMLHSGGVVTVPIEKLPADLQKRFGYDPQRAAAFRAEEAARARAEAAARLDRTATSKALQAIYDPYHVGEGLPSWDSNRLRSHYSQFLKLQKTAHPDYQPAIKMLILACQKELEFAYAGRNGSPSVSGEPGLSSSPSAPEVAARQHWVEQKAAADSFNQLMAGLRGQARAAWDEGTKLKAKADNKDRPPLRPTPKPSPSDPYLRTWP